MSYVILVCMLAFVMLFGAYIFFSWKVYEKLPQSDPDGRAKYVQEKVGRIGIEAWRFFSPILQAALVLAVALSALTFFI